MSRHHLHTHEIVEHVVETRKSMKHSSSGSSGSSSDNEDDEGSEKNEQQSVQRIKEEVETEEKRYEWRKRFSANIMSSALLIFAVEHGETIGFGQNYYLLFGVFLVFMISTYYIDAYMESLFRVGDPAFRPYYKLVQNVNGYMFQYISYLVIKMVSDILKGMSSNGPWTPSKLIIPVMFILVVSGAETVFQQRVFLTAETSISQAEQVCLAHPRSHI
mgnify:FL=1